MNYYLVQSKYFLIFIIIFCWSLALFPFIKNTFADISDSILQSNMRQIQAEMFFIEQREGTFAGACYEETVDPLVQNLIYEYGNLALCRTNEPINSQILVCTQFRSGAYFCIDGEGISCQFYGTLKEGYTCKEIA